MATSHDTISDLISHLGVQVDQTDALVGELKTAWASYGDGGDTGDSGDTGGSGDPGTSVRFQTRPGTIFYDGVNGPKDLDETAATSCRFELVLSLTELNGTQALACCTREFRVLAKQNGSIDVEMQNYSPNVAPPSGTFVAGKTYKIVAVQDRPNDLVYVELSDPDGRNLSRWEQTVKFSSGDTFQGGRDIRFLTGYGRDTCHGATITSLKVWLGDPKGLGTPDKVIAGTAAQVRADPWYDANSPAPFDPA